MKEFKIKGKKYYWSFDNMHPILQAIIYIVSAIGVIAFMKVMMTFIYLIYVWKGGAI